MGGAQRTFAKKLLGTLTLLLAFAQFGMSEPIPLSTALDAAELTFTTGGDADWFGQTATTYDGVDAARSGAIGSSQTSYMETTVSGPGTLSFWWKTSCEKDWDQLRFYVDESLLDCISGSTGWKQISHDLPAGSHTLKWQYTKDGSVSSEEDCGWVDQVVWAPPTAPTITTLSPLPVGTVDSAYSVTLAANGGKTPYTWSLDSGSLPAGLSLVGNVISGVPAVSGTSSFTVRITGGDSLFSTQTFDLTINPVEVVADDDDDDEVGDVGYLCAPAGDAELTTGGSYDGYFYAAEAFDGAEEASAVRGTLLLKVTSPAGKLSAKATLQGGNVSFKGKAWSATELDDTRRAELTATGGERLVLFVRQNRIWGTLTGGKAGAATLMLDGARNRFADRGDVEAAARLEEFMGYYTVALPAAEDGVISAAPEVDAAPQGVGYLTMTVRAKGRVKIAGVLADGTKVSRSSRLILFDGCGPEACVPLFAPLYSKKGWAGGLLWIDPETRVVETDRDIGWFIRWENPGRVGPDGFSLLLDACGGFYGTGAALAAAYLFGAETDDTAYFAAGEAWEWAAQPEDVPVAGAGSRLTITKGAKPKKFSDEGDVWYEYDEANSANATFAFTSRTGIFKGKFSLYCDYENEAGKLIHKAVSVPYAGVLTPLRSEAFDDLPVGLGYCLIPDNDPAVKAFRLKRSRPVWLEEQ